MFLRSAFITLLFSAQAFALPIAQQDYSAVANLRSDFAVGYNFEGIIALSNCSGSLIRLTKSLDTDAAMVLTNGHCLAEGMPKPGEVISNHATNRSVSILNPANGRALGRVNAVKILYATMTRTDMAVYILKETYKEIFDKYAIRPLLLSEKGPTLGEGIEVISGYWKRGYNCNVESIAHILREDQWTMNESIRYSRPGCDVIGGTSGSPVISVQSREVIGANNTINENGKECEMSNPCEVDAAGVIFAQKGIGYAQQTSWLYTCLTAQYVLDLDLPACKLPK